MKKVVLKLDILDERVKQKAMKNVSSLAGVDSIAMDMKDKKLTVTGDVDPVTVVSKLRKICQTEIESVGPAKEPEKKKEEGGGDKKKEDDKKQAEEALKSAYQQPYLYYPHSPYYSKVVDDETPNCVIC